MATPASNPSTREAEIGGSLGHTGQTLISELPGSKDALSQKIRWRAIEEDPLYPPPTSVRRAARVAKCLASIRDALGSILSINCGRKGRKNGGRNRRGRRKKRKGRKRED